MSRESSPSTTALQVARRLLARQAAHGGESEPEMISAALQRTCARVCENLRDAMGDAGCSALLARALARTEADHPALNSIRRLNGAGIHLDGVAASVETHGVAPVTAAIEALLAALLEILGRLIGEDMAIRLMDDHASRSRTGGGAQAS